MDGFRIRAQQERPYICTCQPLYSCAVTASSGKYLLDVADDVRTCGSSESLPRRGQRQEVAPQLRTPACKGNLSTSEMTYSRPLHHPETEYHPRNYSYVLSFYFIRSDAKGDYVRRTRLLASSRAMANRASNKSQMGIGPADRVRTRLRI
jgi:hypothetical protein